MIGRMAALAAVLHSALCAAGRVEIAVCDDVELRDKTLDRAKFLVDYVLNRAGVWVGWTSCGAPGGSIAPRVTVRIRSSRVPLDRYAATWESGRAYRVAGRQDYAEVFFDAVHGFATARMTDTGELLGCSMLHEISHLLGNPDTEHGIMAGRFGRAEEDDLVHRRLRFTRAEQTVIVEELRRRMSVRPGAMVAMKKPESTMK